MKWSPPKGDLARLLGAQVASQMGDAAFTILMLWVVIDLTGSRSLLGMAAAVNYLPILLFGMAGGYAADRLSKKGILIVSDACRAAVVLSLPVLHAMGMLPPWALVAAGFLLYTASAFFNPARDALIPSLVSGENLVGANAAIQLSIPAGFLLGPSLVSILLAWVSPITLFGGVGALFAISVLFLAGLPKGASSGHEAGSPRFAEFFEGLRVSWKDSRLLWLLAITAVDNLFIMGPAIVGMPIFVREVLHRGDQVYALTETAMSLGMLAGLPLTYALNRKLGQGRILIAGLFIDGITYLPLLWMRDVPALLILLAAHGLAIPMITVTRTSLVQRISPPEALGRIFALISISVIGLTAVSSALTGWACERIPVEVLFAAIAVGASLCAPAAWLSRAFRES